METQDPRDLNEFLQPYMDLMSFDVRAIYELPYRETLDHFRNEVRQST